jgi:hypothetical protein
MASLHFILKRIARMNPQQDGTQPLGCRNVRRAIGDPAA